MNDTQCPFCGSENLTVLYLGEEPEDLDTLKCEDCDARFED